jgi:small subunit ribosomal protein S20
MPTTKSAEKRLRTSLKRRLRNQRRKKSVKTTQKEFAALIEQKQFEQAEEAMRECFKALDKAAKLDVLQKNKVARDKSRLARTLNAARNPASA